MLLLLVFFYDNKRCSFVLSCDGADQTRQDSGRREEEKLERQCSEQSMHAGGSGHRRLCLPALQSCWSAALHRFRPTSTLQE